MFLMPEITADTLSQLHPFNNLPADQIKPLLEKVEILSLEIGEHLQAENYSNFFLYLLEGGLCFIINFA